MNVPRRNNASIIALVILAALVAFWLGRQQSGRMALDPPAVLLATQRLKQLVTIRYTIQKVVGLKETRPLAGEESLLLIVQGRVLGGIDLAQLHPGDIHVLDKRKIAIKLPRPQILDASLDEKETKVWDRKLTWWTPWSADPNMEHRARLTALEAIKQAALEQGLLKEAQRQAESLIRELFAAQGIEVTFEGEMSRIYGATMSTAEDGELTPAMVITTG